jgi:hypothetical protein
LFNSEVWWFKPAQPQFRCQVIHHSFFRVIFVSQPASDCSDPVVGQLWNIERGEAPAARQVVLRLLQALVLQECIDNQLGIFSRIISHLIHLRLPISRFFVAFGSRADLLLCAKHLFVEAMLLKWSGEQDWAQVDAI